MVQLTLSIDDARVLHEVLISYLSDLRMEIADTDSQNFREELKIRKDLLIRLLDQLDVNART